MERRRGLVAALLALPFVAAFGLARLAVPRLGDAVALRLRAATRALGVHRSGRSVKGGEQVVAASNDVVSVGDAGASFEGGAPSRSPNRGASTPSPEAREPGGGVAPVHVGADAVQRAIDDDGRTIRARTTRGPDGRPAGARLTGVNGAGLGLRDGDIIVAVDGKPTMDDEAATDAALGAVARGASVLHATLTRDGQRFEVVLDLPLAPLDAGSGGKRSR